MRQAGRYLPEYRAVRERFSFTEMLRHPEVCAEVTLQPIDRFGMDAAILFSDILTVVEVFGRTIDFQPGPTIDRPIRTSEDIAALRLRDVDSTVGYVYEAVTTCRKALANRVPLIGFCGAPLTTVAYLVEGQGSRDFHHIKRLAWAEPSAFADLMHRMTDVLITYLHGQVRAGAQALQVFESWGNMFAPRHYAQLVSPHMKRLFAAAKTFGVPVIAYMRGGLELAALAQTFGADVLGLDWSVDMDRAVANLGPDVVVQGNIDPAFLLTNEAALTAEVERVSAAARGARAHIMNLGHGISRHTDPSMVQALVDRVHSL